MIFLKCTGTVSTGAVFSPESPLLSPGYNGEPIVETASDAEMVLQQYGHVGTDFKTFYEGKVKLQ